MIAKAKTFLFGLSLLCNALLIGLAVNALAGNTASLSFYRMDKGMASAVIANVPAMPGAVTFNPVEITLKIGESASLQITSVIEGRQANWIINALYDRSVIAVSRNPFGITITAVGAGESVMQTLANNGIVDVAVIRVVE